MATRLPTNSRNASANGVVDRFDAGAGPGTVKVYSGAQPASAADAPTGSLLATIALGDPAFGDAAAGVATANAIPTVQGSGTGTAGWFRGADSDGNTVMDGSVTATGGGGDMTLDSTSITSGQDVTVTSFTYTQPAG